MSIACIDVLISWYRDTRLLSNCVGDQQDKFLLVLQTIRVWAKCMYFNCSMLNKFVLFLSRWGIFCMLMSANYNLCDINYKCTSDIISQLVKYQNSTVSSIGLYSIFCATLNYRKVLIKPKSYTNCCVHQTRPTYMCLPSVYLQQSLSVWNRMKQSVACIGKSHCLQYVLH